MSEVVKSLFEDEARKAVQHCLRRVCPWATEFSDVSVRGDMISGADDGRQVDLFAYAKGDNSAPCVDEEVSGIRAITASMAGVSTVRVGPPHAIAADAMFSPGFNAWRGPLKYIVGEAYGGSSVPTMREKVHLLDTLVHFVWKRYCDREDHKGGISSVIGAAIIVFRSGRDGVDRGVRRAAALASAVRLVVEELRSCSYLRALAGAGRLLVMVTDVSQTPVTTSQRILAMALAGSVRIVDPEADYADAVAR